MNMLNKAKDAAAGKAQAAADAAQKAAEGVKASADQYMDERQKKQEAQWRNQVMTDPDGDQFKPFADWSAEFEPKSEKKASKESEESLARSSTSALVQKASEQARQSLLNKVHENITSTLLKLMMEVSSRALGPMESKIRDKDADAAAVLNAMNGILLSYRFGLSGKKAQFVYLRTIAVGNLSRAANKIFEGHDGVAVDDIEAKLAGIRSTIQEELTTRHAEIRAMVETMPFLQPNSAQMAEVAAGVVSARLAEKAAAKAGSDVGACVGAEAEARMKEKVQATNFEGVDEGIVALQAFLKTLVLAKLDAMMVEIPGRAFQVLEVVRVVYLKVKEKKDDLAALASEQTKGEEAMFEEVEKVYAELNDTVSGYVGGLVAMLNMLMGPPAVDSSEDS